MKTWQMEYSQPFPNIRVRFTVNAETFEEAIDKGDAAVINLRRTATYEIGQEELHRQRNAP